jgi:23S rRNA pseudouridine1911/1915/1917 synthase
MYSADPSITARLGLERQWLHATQLAFEHPDSREWVTYTAEYPPELEHALSVLRGD